MSRPRRARLLDYRPKLDQQSRQAKFAEERAALFEPRSLDQFDKARKWLRQFRKLSSLNRRGTSYGLKHVAEPEIGYVTNGVFIAAAIAEGFTIARADNGPNARP